MKILIQWARAKPNDWVQIDSSQWLAVAKKPEPGTNARIDGETGWINDLNVQGVQFNAFDHYAVLELRDGSGGVQVVVWNDDPDDWPDGWRHAIRTTILPLAPDSSFGGAFNTRQSRQVFGEDKAIEAIHPQRPVESTEIFPWREFVKPPERFTYHGIWLDDELYARHLAKQTLHGWREWTEGMPKWAIGADKQIARQAQFGLRSPKQGTKTYYARNTDRAIGAYVATYEDAFEATMDTAASEQVSLPPADPATSILGWAFSTPSGEPNSTDWPNGTYKFQIDCTANSGVNYGLLTVGTANGKFARVASDLASELESTTQAEAVFTNTGLKLATKSWNPAAGATGDRFACVVACQSTSTHAAKTITLELNEADDYAEGPWEAAVVLRPPVQGLDPMYC